FSTLLWKNLTVLQRNLNSDVIKVYGEDSHSRSVWVSPGATAREACHMLVQTAHCSDQENWALLEVHPTLGLERCLEDHEVVLEVQATWSLKGDTRFGALRLNFKKNCNVSSYLQHFENSASVGQLSVFTHQNLLKSGTCPEIQGFLHVKESSRKAWKKVYFFLRRSGLYSSTKGSSKVSRSSTVTDFSRSNYMTSSLSKSRFCVFSSRSLDLKILCAENEQTRTCWTSAFRLFKYGKQLQRNYEMSKAAPQKVEGSKLADGKASLVAMDFSGKAGGRVIQNPMEAQRAEREEGLAWRVRMEGGADLVEFHQINKGILPVCLKHPCVCVAL
uniref:Growth factor receptor bound protein 7 n=1 Tax=Neolamprologus brichardi TaxID=32507 RepID=A0A3Q4IAK0_NEOBR